MQKDRLYSLDALRGFDMFWIIGGGTLITHLANSTDWGWLHVVATQMKHVEWEGFRFYDLIFPLFMFISGAVIPYSILSKLEKGVPKKQLLLKTARRFLLLFILGLVYNGVFKSGFADARYVSVLAQIGFAYFFTVLIVLFSDSQLKRLLWLIGILTGVAILQLFVPIPGFGAGVLTPEGHINGYIDRMLLPGRLAYDDGTYDALGILSTISSVGVTLMGFFAGTFLKTKKLTGVKKTGILTVIGVCLVILGILVSPLYPPIKKCWTSTFSLLAGGTSFMLIALFYLIVDVWGYRKWSFFFRVIGMNSIAIYIGARIINFWYTSEFLLGWISGLLGSYGSLVIVLGVIGIEWLMLYYMYKNKIFLKV